MIGRIRSLAAVRPVAMAAGLTAVAVTAVAVWGAHSDSGVSVCPSRTIFGVTCPGCGMTRALVSLFRGDWAGSWDYHPLAVAIVVQTALAVVVVIGVSRGRWRLPPRLMNGWLSANVVMLLGVWLIRIPLGALPPG